MEGTCLFPPTKFPEMHCSGKNEIMVQDCRYICLFLALHSKQKQIFIFIPTIQGKLGNEQQDFSERCQSREGVRISPGQLPMQEVATRIKI